MFDCKYNTVSDDISYFKFTENNDFIVIEFLGGKNLIDIVFLNDFYKILCHLEDNDISIPVIFRGDFNKTIKKDESYIKYLRKWEQVLLQIGKIQTITIFIMNGNCSSLGLQMAMSCDFRLGTINSNFVSDEVKQGYLPGTLLFQLAKFVGLGVARRMLFTGFTYSAESMKNIGLLDEIHRFEDIDIAITNFISNIALCNRHAVSLSRRLVNESYYTSYEDSLGHIIAAQHRLNGLNNNGGTHE